MCKGRDKILRIRYLRKLLWENFHENVYLKVTSSLNFIVEQNYLADIYPTSRDDLLVKVVLDTERFTKHRQLCISQLSWRDLLAG